jgi:hypothetical protein
LPPLRRGLLLLLPITMQQLLHILLHHLISPHCTRNHTSTNSSAPAAAIYSTTRTSTAASAAASAAASTVAAHNNLCNDLQRPLAHLQQLAKLYSLARSIRRPAEPQPQLHEGRCCTGCSLQQLPLVVQPVAQLISFVFIQASLNATRQQLLLTVNPVATVSTAPAPLLPLLLLLLPLLLLLLPAWAQDALHSLPRPDK